MMPLFLKPWHIDTNKTFVEIRKKYQNLNHIYYHVFPVISMSVAVFITNCLRSKLRE